MLFSTNSASLIQRVLLIDDAGDPITGVAFNSGSLAISYNLQTVGAWVTPVLVDGTLGTYLENSWKEIGGGVYQWCPPNAVVVANTNTLVRAVYGANDPQYDTIEARLPAVILRNGLTHAEVMDLLLAASIGVSSQPTATTEKFKFADADDAFTTTFDGDGNRTGVVLH